MAVETWLVIFTLTLREPAMGGRNELLEAGCTPDQAKAITGHITTQMIEKYGREVSKRRQAKAAIVKLTDAKKNKG